MTPQERFLAYLNESWGRILDDPSCVPGSSFDEKILYLCRPHVPEGWVVYVKGRFSIPHGGRAFHVLFMPVGVEVPADFDIRLASTA